MSYFSSLRHFNPLPPHGGRQMFYPIPCLIMVFQSTPSAWRETLLPILSHLLKMYFNPLPPHGGRPVNGTAGNHRLYFNPLPPHGGRPVHLDIYRFVVDISIHSLRMEGDCIPISRILQTCHFNPLPPHGGRRRILSGGNVMSHFNPLPPHGGRLQRADKLREVYRISIHSLRMEGDT